MAELFYRAANQYITKDKKITVTPASLPFWKYFAPEVNVQVNTTYPNDQSSFSKMVQSLEGWADAFMRRIKYYTPPDGHLTEEYNLKTGAPQGAQDLTWSYAALLTAAFARAQVNSQSDYVQTLANIPVPSL